MAVLAVQAAQLAGLAVAFAAADAAGDSFENDGRTVVRVKNASAAPVNVTVDSKTPCSHGFDHDQVVAVPAGAERDIGPLPRERFGSPATVAYSAAAGVTVAAVKY